jgi:multiple sugar transport system substrate-binding protein
MPAGEGNKPGCGGNATALFIPVGAQNPDGAKEMINWLLSPDHNPIYVLGPGAGIPVLKSVAATEQFQSTFYKQAEEVVAASNCEFIWPTVTKSQDAEKAIMNAVYKLIKTDPTADIAIELQKAEDEFNNAQ